MYAYTVNIAVTFFSLFLSIYSNNYLSILQSSALVEAQWLSQWHNQPLDRIANLLIFSSMFSQKPLRLKAGKFYTLSLDTFISVSRKWWEYFFPPFKAVRCISFYNSLRQQRIHFLSNYKKKIFFVWINLSEKKQHFLTRFKEKKKKETKALLKIQKSRLLIWIIIVRNGKPSLNKNRRKIITSELFIGINTIFDDFYKKKKEK